MKYSLLSVLRIATRAKTCRGIAVIAILSSVSTAWAISGPYINSPPPDDCAWCDIKKAADFAKTLTGYFSTGKNAVDIVETILGAAGLIEKDPGISEVMDLIRLGFDDAAWRDIEIYLGRSVGAAETVISNIRRRDVTSKDDDDSNGAVRALIDKDAEKAVFSFPYNKMQSDGMESLGYSKDDLDRQGPNSFYDWRLGISALLRVISYRLVVLAAFHPDFRNDGYGWTDLDDYRVGLTNHYKMMLKGVRCRTTYGLGSTRAEVTEWDRCADIHTGLSTGDFRRAKNLSNLAYLPKPDPAPTLCHSDATWDLFWDGAPIASQTVCATSPEILEEVLADLKREVIALMPLYEVKAMIDTLYLLTHPMRDLTAQYQRLPSYVTPSLCLEAKGETNGAALQLWTCDNDPLQHWVYDRPSGHISNPDTGKCLEISYGAHASGQSFPVSISDCYDDEWQRWTYDPETHVLLSAMGTVLTIEPRIFTDYLRWFFTDKWFDLGDPVSNWPREDTVSPPQQWLADQAPPVICKRPTKQNTPLFGDGLPNC